MKEFLKRNQDNIPLGSLRDKHHFIEAVDRFLQTYHGEEVWCILSIDIENMKLFNEWYGWEAGDSLLSGVYNYLGQLQERLNGIVGYLGNDDFAVMIPYEEAQIEEIYQGVHQQLASCDNKLGFLPTIGVYEITDRSTPAMAMYDWAEFARKQVQGNYLRRIMKFNAGMRESLEAQILLHSDIRRALAEHEFTFYLQPKCNMENGKLVGAEALVRWLSPEKGMVSPGVFIPFLERTGFITELDVYIWEEVCRWLRATLDSSVQPVPVSVNVSRADLYAMDVPAFFREMIQKYDLPPRMIELEITESTYTESADYISGIVSELRRAGFRVLMDDFGSGYSSLNMLKDVEVDVLKVDMRFLEIDEKNARKGIGILEAVHNMAQLLGVDIIVEGVETEEQKAFLLKMGCGYGQGYYFYRPMPKEHFDELLRDGRSLDDQGFQDRRIEQLVLKDLLSEDMFSEIMINNMLGAVVFYDFCDGEIIIRRYNENYIKLLGNQFRVNRQLSLRERLDEADYEKMVQLLLAARENHNEGAEGDIHRIRADGSKQWVRVRVFFLREQDGHEVYYSSISDVTDIHLKNLSLIEKNEALQFLNNDMPGGYYCHENDPEAKLLHISDRFLDIVGYTREEIRDQFDDKLQNMIHPDDSYQLSRSMSALEEFGGNYSLPCRIRSKRGYLRVTMQSRLVKYDDIEFFQGIVLYDLMSAYTAPEADSGKAAPSEDSSGAAQLYNESLMPCGVYQSEADGEHHFSYVSESMLNMLGYSRKAFQEKFRSTRDLVYHEDREQVDEAVLRQIQRSNGVSCEFRVELPDGSLKWVCSQGRMTTDANGKRWFYVCMMDYDYLKERLQEQEWQQQKYRTLAEVPGMIVFDYDPLRDRMTVERTQASGAIDTMVVEKFIEDIEHHPWLSKENVDNQRRVLLELSNHQGTGNTEFKACLAGDSEFCWYRTYVRSIVNESGKVYRIVGRSDKLQDENKWMDGPVSKTVLDLPAQEKQTVLEYANNEAIVNEGLRLALEQSTPDESLQVLLAYLGRCLRSERVYIFEEQPDGSVSNTYEWCSESAVPQKEALQNVPFEAVELWYRNFQKNQNVVIQDLEATKDSDPLAYEYLKPQNIFTLVVSPIVSDKGIIGFFGVDNAPAALLTHISVLMEIISHFIDSLLRRRNLVQRLELMSVYDQLTGLKNRHGMERHISCLREGNALGIFYLDVMGLKKTNDTLGHQAGDELLKRASACLREAFAGDELYRVGGDEFLVLCEGITEDELSRRQELLESIMKENDVQMAVGRVWKTQYAGDFDQMIETADAQMYEDKRRRYAMVRMTLA